MHPLQAQVSNTFLELIQWYKFHFVTCIFSIFCTEIVLMFLFEVKFFKICLINKRFIQWSYLSSLLGQIFDGTVQIYTIRSKKLEIIVLGLNNVIWLFVTKNSHNNVFCSIYAYQFLSGEGLGWIVGLRLIVRLWDLGPYSHASYR